MAAPLSAYRNKSLFGRNKANTANIEHLLAILQVNKATMLARFYLDDLFVARLPDGTDGVCGMVIVGGANYAMHAAARRGSVNGGNLILLNDAGLNTLGKVTLLDWTLAYANRVKAQTQSISAFYVPTTARGFKFKKASESTWSANIWFPSSSMAQAVTLTTINHLVSGAIQKHTSYHFIFLLNNVEGIYESPVYPLLTLDFVLEDQFYPRSAPCGANTGAIMMLYFSESTRAAMNNLTTTGTFADLFAYTDENMTLEPATGWYYASNEGYSYFYQKGAGFSQRQYCTPVPVIKVSISLTIYASGYWEVFATKTAQANFTAEITITGTATGAIGGNPIGTIPYSVTIPANQNSGYATGSHSIDFVNQALWTMGLFTSSRTDLVANTEISGFATGTL